MIATKEEFKNGHEGAGICTCCRLELSFIQIALHDGWFGFCRKCATAVSGWLAADLKAEDRRGGEDEEFQRFEKGVQAGLRFLNHVLEETPPKLRAKIKLHKLLDHAREVAKAEEP